MAHLRVGDIEIRGASVTIGNHNRGAGALRDQDRGAGALRDQDRGAGALRDQDRGAGALREQDRGAGALREQDRGALRDQQTSGQSVQMIPAQQGQQALAQPAASSSLMAGSPDGLAVLRAVPVRPIWFVGSGAVLFMVGLWAFLASGVPRDIINYILGWGILSSIGVGVAGLGAMKHWLELSGEASRRAQLEGELRPLLDRMRAILRTANAEQTVEWIVQQLGEPEDKVVRALGALRARGEVQEELNTGTGDWYYFMAPQERLAAPRDLDARLREQERNGQR